MSERVRNLTPGQYFLLKRTGDRYEFLGHKRDTPGGTRYVVQRSGFAIPAPPRWDNPPHRSHLCHNPDCKYVWRPADMPTNGVKAIKTKGKNDSDYGDENFYALPHS